MVTALVVQWVAATNFPALIKNLKNAEKSGIVGIHNQSFQKPHKTKSLFNTIMFTTTEQIEDFLTSDKSNDKLINIWNNLQDSFDTDKERISFFNKVAAKQITNN